MRKILFFAVVLLLTLTLPTVSAKNPHYSQRTVTFAGDIAVKEGNATLEVWDPSSKIVIEWEPINLTYQVNINGTDSTNFTWLSENWLGEYEDSFERWNDTYDKWLNFFGYLYLRVFKNKGEAMIEYWFGRYENETNYPTYYDGQPRYRLEGFGVYDELTGNITVTDGPFKIYELTYKRNGKVRALEELWTGSLSFTIEIE